MVVVKCPRCGDVIKGTLLGDVMSDRERYRDEAAQLRADNERLRGLLKTAAQAMDYLGDKLNNMDAILDEDMDYVNHRMIAVHDEIGEYDPDVDYLARDAEDLVGGE